MLTCLARHRRSQSGKKLTACAAVFIALLCMACSEESNPEFEKETFTSIFDNKAFLSSFHPIDLAQTPDGGYLILAERKITDSNFRGIYLLKADAYGNFVKELLLDDQYVNPVADLMSVDDAFYFIGMDGFNLQALLIKVDGNADAAEVTPMPGITYPAAASVDGNGFLLLSYNHVERASVISGHDFAGQVTTGPKAFGIGAGDEVAEPIMNHYLGTGRRFPFRVGKVSDGLYFFNGFENYTFSIVFTNLQGDEPQGIVQGQQDDGGFSALIPLGGGTFAASRFNFGENYFLPRVTLETNGLTAGAFLGGLVLPELIPDAPVRILRATIGATNALIFASDTRSKQIGLFFYNEADGAFISSRYLGFSNPFEVGALTLTEDGGLAVCGTTYLAGRFPRICLFKISKEALMHQVE